MEILSTIKGEVIKYLFDSVETPGGQLYSEWKLKKRIYNYKTQHYPTGKVNDVGEIEYWFDVIGPRVNNEVKNLRLDSKFFMYWSKNPITDFPAVFLMNAKNAEFMEETGRAEELSESSEDFSADGNILFRKTDKNYEKCDPMNTFPTNTLARSVDQTAINERFYLTQSELRQKGSIYNNVEAIIKHCGGMSLTPTAEISSSSSTKTSPMYEMFRRTGEISEKALFEAQGKEGGDPNKFVLARVVVAGLQQGEAKKGENGEKTEYVAYAEQLSGKMCDYFKEAHRGPYKGKFWREGLYQLCFDQQTAYNELTIELMRVAPWLASAIFTSDDMQTFQNIRHAMVRGTILKTKDLKQLQVTARVETLLNLRNDILNNIDAIANSYEIARGITPASGTPLGATQLANENLNKLFDFLRKKLAVPYRYVYREFVMPDLVKHLRGQDIIKLTGSEQFLDQFRRLGAEMWFNSNLAIIGPHTPEMREVLIAEKTLEMAQKDPMIENSKEIWKEITPRLYVTIVGEAYNTAEVETILQLLPLETDANRRAWGIDYIYKSKGIPVPPPVDPTAEQQQLTTPGQETERKPVSTEATPTEAEYAVS